MTSDHELHVAQCSKSKARACCNPPIAPTDAEQGSHVASRGGLFGTRQYISVARYDPGPTGAFGIFWMRQFSQGSIPNDLVDGGRLDGCTHFQLYLNVALPPLRPALAFLGIFTFINTWNDYFWPLVVLVNPERQTLQVALAQLQGICQTDFATVMAGTLFSTTPLVVIFILGSKQFIGNIAAGALKT